VDTLAGGTVVVRNPSTPLLDLDSAWTVETRLRLGRRQGEGPEIFGSVADVVVDGMGRIWVLDGQAQEVRVFGPDGGFVRTVGGQGRGPGELAGAIGLSRGPGGRVWALDTENARISVFDTTGAFLRSHRRESGGYTWSWRGGFDGRGRWYDAVYVPGAAASDPPAGGFRMVRYDSMSAPPDTLPVPSSPWERQSFELGDESRRIAARVPFTPGVVWTLDPEGNFVVSPQRPYRIAVLSPRHDTLRVVERPWDPVPVTDEEVEAQVEELSWFTEQGGDVDRSRIPDEKPAVKDLFVDRTGHLWVLPFRPYGEVDDAWDVFDPEGRWLGRLALPVALEPDPEPVVTSDRIVGVHTDEVGVEHVVVLALDRGGRPRARDRSRP
jgi:hypothetical protein